MSTYRVGNHQPQNVYRGEEYIGVMFTAEDAALVVEALNGAEPADPGNEGFALLDPAEAAAAHAEMIARVAARRRSLFSQPHSWTPHCSEACNHDVEPADSCSCTKVGPDPACPVHQGRRARGPKPPPVGEGCICDGSGRTCPRHGAVI